jgi:hypothetical protein
MLLSASSQSIIYFIKNTKKPTQEEQQQQWGNVYAHVLFQNFLGHHKKL